MSYQALALTWRPQRLVDVVGQAHVVQALTHALEQQRIHHAYLFTGTRGVGKTSFARILAQCLNCEQGITATPCGECDACQAIPAGHYPDLIEIDAASRTKVEDTRELLANVHYAPTQGRFKIYLIDEVHMLSGHSFNALLKTLEEPPAHVKFFLATTDPQKLPVTVLSRCLQFHLHNLTTTQMLPHLTKILEHEKISFETSALELLCQASQGSLRDALSLLDQAIAYSAGNIELSNVQSMLGRVGQQAIDDLLLAVVARDSQAVYEQIQTLAQFNCDFDQALEDVLSTLHMTAVAQQVKTTDISPAVAKLQQQCSAEDIQLFYQIGLLGRRDLPYAPTPQMGFTMSLLRMLAFSPVIATAKQPVLNTHLEKTNTTPTVPSQTQTHTQPEPQAKPKTKSPKAISTSSQWQDILPELNLRGAAYAVASHCSIASWENDELVLNLDPAVAPILTPQQETNLKAAIKAHLGDKFRIEINIAASEQATPAQQATQAKREKQQKTEQALHEDPQVQALLSEFNATIDPDTIVPISQEE